MENKKKHEQEKGERFTGSWHPPRHPSAAAHSSGDTEVKESSCTSNCSGADLETIVNQVPSRANLQSSTFSVASDNSSWLFNSAYCNQMTSGSSYFLSKTLVSNVLSIQTVDVSLMNISHISSIHTLFCLFLTHFLFQNYP